MSAVWRAARGAVRRRRLQTIVIGIVVAISTMMSVVALGILAASSGPFEQAYTRQAGAHLVAEYDNSKASDAALTRAARAPEVAAAAGPFSQGIVTAAFTEGPAVSVTFVGRADPGGPVDRLNVWKGRWADKPGEIVLNQNPASRYLSVGNMFFGRQEVGAKVRVSGGPVLTVVGFAFTVSKSADAWVTPEQMAALHPTASQVLYRFAPAATAAQISAAQSAVTAGLPAGALLGSQSYLTLKAAATAKPNTFVPFLVIFGCLGLAVAILIVVNVISGAVVAGFRHIGVLKALGFTPTQVMAVYLTMVALPAIAGSVIGTVLGNLMAKPLLTNAFLDQGAGDIGVPLWLDGTVLVGMPVVVALSALGPVLRARSLSASEAISAGSTPHAGRALRIQRWLGGTRLPRSVSLGLGQPFARPARSALTLFAVLLGVTSATLAIGLANSLLTYQKADNRTDAVQVQVVVPGGPDGGELSDPAAEALLRSLPDTAHVMATAFVPMRLVGTTQDVSVGFWRGDSDRLGYRVLQGHLPNGLNQVAVSQRFLTQHGLAVGDPLTVELDGKRTQLQIVGQLLFSSANQIYSNWATLAGVAPSAQADSYEVQLKPGANVDAYLARVHAAYGGWQAAPADNSDSFVTIVIATVTLLTLLLSSVAALGVFNTVILNTRERRRDLGMLKSIGMTPGQVTVMVVTSMAALGAIGALLGVPIGIGAHRLVVPAMADAAQVSLPDFMLDVFHPPLLALLFLAGVGIAALGALLPARSAARITVSEALHNE